MATTSERAPEHRSRSGQVAAVLAVVLLLALTAWTATAGHGEEPGLEHPSPGTVVAVEGSEFSFVTLTADGAEKIGLELARVEQIRSLAGNRTVPYASLVHGADGTIWVYASAGDPLRFRRQTVEVATVDDRGAILTSGPAVGTTVVGIGSAELYGTEFEVGH